MVRNQSEYFDLFFFPPVTISKRQSKFENKLLYLIT